MKKIKDSLIINSNHLIAKSTSFLNDGKGKLISILFHSLFENEDEISVDHIDPQQKMTIAHFHKTVRYFLKRKYRFVSPNLIKENLSLDSKYVLITFDDGYFNNRRVLPILNKYDIPAVFFIAPKYITSNKCFWWDVVYREEKKRKKTFNEIERKQIWLKKRHTKIIENYIENKYGSSSLTPLSDLDRPFTPSELIEFSKNRNIFIGNHTHDHEILTNHSNHQIRKQIQNAQKILHEITDVRPTIISYPNGNYSDDVVRIAKECKIQLGITLDHKTNSLPLSEDQKMRLNRFILWGNKYINKQCDVICSKYSLSDFRRLF